MDFINDSIKDLEHTSREIQLEISDNKYAEVSESELEDQKKYLKLLTSLFVCSSFLLYL